MACQANTSKVRSLGRGEFQPSPLLILCYGVLTRHSPLKSTYHCSNIKHLPLFLQLLQLPFTLFVFKANYVRRRRAETFGEEGDAGMDYH